VFRGAVDARSLWVGIAGGAVEVAILGGVVLHWWESPPWPVLIATGLVGPFGALATTAPFFVPLQLVDFLVVLVPLFLVAGILLNGLMYGLVGRVLTWSKQRNRLVFAVTVGLIAAYFIGGSIMLSGGH
jgi:hypothetical protein